MDEPNVEPVTDEPEVLNFDIETMTLGEIEELETLSGVPIGAIQEGMDGSRPMGGILRAIAFIIKRRENPDFTYEDAGNLPISQMGLGGAADPKEETPTGTGS